MQIIWTATIHLEWNNQKRPNKTKPNRKKHNIQWYIEIDFFPLINQTEKEQKMAFMQMDYEIDQA